MDTELCKIADRLEKARDLLAFPEIDDNEWIVNKLMEILDVTRGIQPTEYFCPDENFNLLMIKNEILDKIDKAKLSVLRGMHSGDKVANTLVDEVEAVNLICKGMEFRCHECCGDEYMVSCDDVIEIGHPECPICNKPMSLISAPDDIMRTDAHKEAEAYVLRIKTIKNSKEGKV